MTVNLPVPTQNTPPRIGVFDSGVGGLSVLRALRQRLPQCPMWYAADSGFAPYGPQSREYILERSASMCAWLLAQGVQLIVIACNTATTQSAGLLRERFTQVPIVGIEPAVRPAAQQSRRGRIAVLATDATLRSARLLQLQQELRADHPAIQWHNYAPSGLVSAIEQQARHTMRREIAAACDFVTQHDCDTAVLGCTHYPLLLEQWQNALPAVLWLDPAAAVAERAAQVLGWSARTCPAQSERDHHPESQSASLDYAPLVLHSTGDALAWQTLRALVNQHIPKEAHGVQALREQALE